MKKRLLGSSILLLFISACQHELMNPNGNEILVDTTVIVNPSNPSTTPKNDTVCFTTEVLPVYQSYCASPGCHDATTKAEGIVTIDFASILKGIKPKNAAGSKYYTIIGGDMPPKTSPQLSLAQKEVILKWINQGALNTKCVGGTCDSTKSTYHNSISTLLATYCNGCHGLPPGSGNILLNTYANAKLVGLNSKQVFLNSINFKAPTASKNMPPAGQLSSCNLTQITKWINDGCPQ